MELIPLAVFWIATFEFTRLLGLSRGDSRRSWYSLALGVWGIVAVYAMLHDQYIVRIAPEHFTAYHPPMWGLTDPHALAAAWAFGASWYPGTLLGIATTLAARADSMPRISARFVLLSVVIVVCLTEVAAALSGLATHLLGHGIYPDRFYPAQDLPLQVTQSIQLTCYWVSAGLSLGLVGLLVALRYRPGWLKKRQLTA
jgi:hypothetical protein